LRFFRLGAVKGGVEAGDLGQVRPQRRQGADRRQVVRLVQRRQRHQGRQFLDHGRRDQGRAGEAHPAVHDAMPGRDQPLAFAVAAQEIGGPGDRAVVPSWVPDRQLCSSWRSPAALETVKRGSVYRLSTWPRTRSGSAPPSSASTV